jgi:hypothetical protein
MKQEQRYNIYKRTHKGIRSLLFEAGARIQQTDFTKKRHAEYAINTIRQTTRSFLYHLRREDSIVYRSVAMEALYIITMLEQTNEKDAALAESVNEFTETYQSLKDKKAKIAFGLQLQNLFFEFMAAVLQHMNKEETVINELLWTKFTDRQLAELEWEIMKQITPDDCTWYTGSIMKGLSNEEIIEWMTGLLANSSPSLKSNLIKTAQKVLPIVQWQMIRGKFAGDKIAA